MKKLLTAAAISLVCMSACNDSSTKETTTTNSTTADSSITNETQNRAKEISDSTKMLDKKLADPNSNYSPDSLKK